MNSNIFKYYLFTGGWAVVSDGIEVWFVSFVFEGDIAIWLFSIVSVIVEEEVGCNCLVGSLDKVVVIRFWEGDIELWEVWFKRRGFVNIVVGWDGVCNVNGVDGWEISNRNDI